MYQYTEFDRQFVHQRAAQYRDQLERHLGGELSTDDFRPLRAMTRPPTDFRARPEVL